MRGRDREVIDAAAEVFARRGYAAATVQDVADALGILKGSLYHYIKTKEDLLFRLMEEIHEDVDALVADVRESGGADPVEQLRTYARKQTTYNLRNLVKVSVYYNDLDQLSDVRRKQIVRRRKVHEDFIKELIIKGQQQGLIDTRRDPQLLVSAVFAVVIWPYRWFNPRGRATADDVVTACVDFVTYGLAGQR